MASEEEEEICRVCRSPGATDNPLFHPCICTGSIGHVHQECLVQWLRHSKKEYCELCKHKYTFKPIYSPDMPQHMPITDLLYGLGKSVVSAVKCWMHYTLVAIAWLGVVPLTASRVYSCIFAGSLKILLNLPMDLISTKNIGKDILHGCLVVACTMSASICIVWLRVQIVNGELPAWLVARPPVNENVDEDAVDDNNNNAHVVQRRRQNNNDLNWNAIDWDRGVEEPTWERILGLDGSLIFIEHVFWVVALNTLFIIVFAFFPYHLGHFFLVSFNLNSYVVATRFEGVVTALCGYVMVAIGFLAGHAILQLTKLEWPERVFGLCYIILKVAFLVLVEMGILPLLSGVWLDICTLKVFNATLLERQTSYLNSPGASLFLHWAIGMFFVFYFATFLMMLKDILRPGTLWFLRSLNDPDFNPIHEMIHMPLHSHFRRFVLSVIVFGTLIIIVSLVPVKILFRLVPGFLPYNSGPQATSPIGEFPLQLMLMQFLLPGLLDQGNAKLWFKRVIEVWAKWAGKLTGMTPYLLGDRRARDAPAYPLIANRNQANNGLPDLGILPEVNPPLPADHWNIGEPYTKPTFFAARLVAVIATALVYSSALATVGFFVPVYLGRITFKTLFGPRSPLSLSEHDFVMHELYTFSTGLYIFLSIIHVANMLCSWLPRGWRIIEEKIIVGCKMFGKAVVAAVFLLGVFPMMLGILFDLTFVIPLRVPTTETPIIFLWQDWALGILLVKLCLAMAIIGPTTWLKTRIEISYRQGLRRLDLKDFLVNTIFPLVKSLAICFSAPYCVGHLFPIVVEMNLADTYFYHWRAYPILITLTVVVKFCIYEVRQFRSWCDRIKNERYLIGKRLMDYEPIPAS